MDDPRSVLARPGPAPDLVLAYGNQAEQVCDVWWPRQSDATALVLMIHGGFWQPEYSRMHVRPMAEGLIASGYTVGAIEYARIGMPGGGWPGTFDDVAEAVDHLPEMIHNVAPLKITPGDPILVGHSAGGHLALWAASRHRLAEGSRWFRPTPAAVHGVAALAPVACLADADRDDVGEGAVAELLGGRAHEHPQRCNEADPIQLLPSGVRTVVVHGDQDRQVPVSQGRAYVAAATARGDQSVMIELAGTEHFALIDPLSTAWPSVLDAVASLVG